MGTQLMHADNFDTNAASWAGDKWGVNVTNGGSATNSGGLGLFNMSATSNAQGMAWAYSADMPGDGEIVCDVLKVPSPRAAFNYIGAGTFASTVQIGEYPSIQNGWFLQLPQAAVQTAYLTVVNNGVWQKSPVAISAQQTGWATNTALRVRVRRQGNTLYASAWRTGTQEPATWHLSWTPTALPSVGAMRPVVAAKNNGNPVSSWVSRVDAFSAYFVTADAVLYRGWGIPAK